VQVESGVIKADINNLTQAFGETLHTKIDGTPVAVSDNNLQRPEAVTDEDEKVLNNEPVT